MADNPLLTPLVASLPATVPFIGPGQLEAERGRPFRARLGANENAFGPPPKALSAMRTALSDVWIYGDAGGGPVRDALAHHLALNRAHIVVGEGIDGLLGNLVRLTVAEGTPVVTSLGAYPTFNYHVNGYGGTLHTVPYREDHEDIDALARKAHEVGARLLYVSNPDNPMGSWHSAAAVTRLIEALPQNCLLVLDEAYIELAPDGTAPEIDPQDPRVIRFRTFSKAYGMAGLRVGYGISAAPLIAAFDKIVNHFGVNLLGQVGATAALQDDAYLAEVKTKIARARDRIADIAAQNGLRALPSAANFIAIDCGQGGAFAQRVVAELAARDVFVRMPGVAPLNRCIRVSCGPDAELDLFAQALPDALRASR